jgi:hypothetical protein
MGAKEREREREGGRLPALRVREAQEVVEEVELVVGPRESCSGSSSSSSHLFAAAAVVITITVQFYGTDNVSRGMAAVPPVLPMFHLFPLPWVASLRVPGAYSTYHAYLGTSRYRQRPVMGFDGCWPRVGVEWTGQNCVGHGVYK